MLDKEIQIKNLEDSIERLEDDIQEMKDELTDSFSDKILKQLDSGTLAYEEAIDLYGEELQEEGDFLAGYREQSARILWDRIQKVDFYRDENIELWEKLTGEDYE